MRLKKITLENFRCYQHLEIDLHANITVLVANNGEGKTAILDAIRIALWPFVSQFDLAKPAYADPANTIMIDDVSIVKSVQQTSNTFGALDKMARQLPASICATSNDSTWQRYRDSETKRSQTKDDAGTKVLKTYAKGVQKAIRNLSEPAQTLPVFGYYGTGRLWREKRLTDGKKGTTETTNQQIRTVAYRDCLDPASSFKQFEEWFTAAYFDVRDYQTNQLLETGIMHIEVPEALIMPIKVVQEAVNQVLAPVGWHSLQYGGEKYDKSLVLKHPKYGVMKISQLSDGIKNMLAMIADIAYRCILLNTHLQENAAKTSPGVVLIDEVDMHLHPQWQQTVIAALRQAFPEIQFIVTTHSPQVLSTVPSESIRIIQHELNSDTNQIISTANLPLKQSRGVASADVMAELQLVDPIPDVEEAHWLTQYKQLITQGEHESDQGEALKEKLLSTLVNLIKNGWNVGV